MAEKSSTQNGYEIAYPVEKLDFEGLGELINKYGLNGHNPAERVEALKQSTPENIAFFLSDLNRSLQGSGETLVDESMVKVGGKPSIEPGDRYDVFIDAIKSIQSASQDINPVRVGDTLALTTVLLHPFADGNGRTSRVLGKPLSPKSKI